ncbi:MAG: DUF1569 domain-containing protein [Bacteroidota bacterium]
MQSLFNEAAHNEITERLNKLKGKESALWGKMTVGQMMKHCQFPLNIVLGKDDYNLKPNWIVSMLFKKSMYNDKPWKKNLPTVPVFKMKEDKDFYIEKPKLEGLINELYSQREKNNWPKHPSFGNFTKEQWSQMQYKHLDHHLKQFGV